MSEQPLPPSLAVTPNIPWEDQTIEQLEAERDYWAAQVKSAPGFTSANQADNFRRACEGWLQVKRRNADPAGGYDLSEAPRP